jgi:hypothetical protein
MPHPQLPNRHQEGPNPPRKILSLNVPSVPHQFLLGGHSVSTGRVQLDLHFDQFPALDTLFFLLGPVLFSFFDFIQCYFSCKICFLPLEPQHSLKKLPIHALLLCRAINHLLLRNPEVHQISTHSSYFLL